MTLSMTYIVSYPVFSIKSWLLKRKCRLWNVAISGLIALIFYNVALTLKLLYGTECTQNIIQVQNEPAPPLHPCELSETKYNSRSFFGNLDIRLGRWDNSLRYKYFDSLVVGDEYAELGERFVICLATQTSVERMYSLVQMSNHWSGPISVSLFAAGNDELNILLQYIIYLRQCYASIRNRVNFHLALPKGRMPTSVDPDFQNLGKMDCLQPEVALKRLLKKRSGSTERWRTKNYYPQNHLRNLARKHCQSGFVFLTDIDIVPSFRLAEELDRFLRRATCRGLCAYVVPTYEIDERVRFPPNKTELVRLAGKGLARPFHQKVFIFNQFATNFSRWQSVVSGSAEVQVSYPVTNFEFLYEPFYVAPDTTPPHDERFLGYGYTRNTQVYEMYVAGYEFLVLSPVFTCHWGLQLKRGRPNWREQQNNENRRRFDAFKQEVFAKYNRDPLRMIQRKT